MPVRRSRGYVPAPLPLPSAGPPVLACGAELKNTFCLAEGGRAFVSHHIGDLENYETLRAFGEGIEHFGRLFDITPSVIAHDLHPEYLSTKYALDRDLPLVGVQHHHAHIASCMADNEWYEPVIGVAFDGTGYGTDGTLWGGEFLVADLTGFQRAGHLRPVPLPGGATAIREPWRMAAAYGVSAELDVARRNAAHWDAVVALAGRGLGSPPTSSAGRLFDAVAAVLGVRDRVNYEGQAAIELEQRADPYERGAYPVRLDDGSPFTVAGADLVAAVVADLRAGAGVPAIAGRFHNAVAGLVVAGAVRLRETTGLTTVALSGGVFQNLLLLERSVAGLEGEGFGVLVHHRLPPNDGGISLGQAAIASAGPLTEAGGSDPR
jgi:hydrogenase maturation protein HypF